MPTLPSVRTGGLLGAALALPFLLACQPAEQGAMQEAAIDSAAVEATVDSLRQAFLDAYNAGEAGQLAGLYTRNAVVLPSDSPPATGRDSIRAYFARELAAGPTLEVEPHEVKPLSPAWVSSGGTYRVTVAPEGAQDTMTVRGSYLILFRNTAEGWKLFRHAATYDSVPPGLPGQ